MDVAAIEAGRDFRQVIDESVATCGVLLAIIGLSSRASSPLTTSEAWGGAWCWWNGRRNLSLADYVGASARITSRAPKEQKSKRTPVLMALGLVVFAASRQTTTSCYLGR